MAILSPFFVLFFCNPGPQNQIVPHAASIYVKLRSLARGSSPQWRRKVRVCRLASGLASSEEFARKRRYSWLQVYQLEKRLISVESTRESLRLLVRRAGSGVRTRRKFRGVYTATLLFLLRYLTSER